MGQKINIPSQNQPFRKQSSLGGDVSFRNLNGTNDNSFITLAKVTKVYYKQGKLDFKLTNTVSIVQEQGGDGSGSAPIPVDFFGRKPDGQVFGHYRPVKVGDLIAIAYINGHRSSPIVIGVYPDSAPDYELISPSMFETGDDNDSGIAETGLAEQKVYPSMQTSYRSGSGTIAEALNGHSFLILDDETANQYDQLWTDYESVGFFNHNGETTNPLKEEAGSWLLVHEDNPDGDGDGHRTRFYVNPKGEIQIVLMGSDSEGDVSVLEGSRKDGFTLKHYNDLSSIKAGDKGQDVYNPDFDVAKKYVELNIGKDQSILMQAVDQGFSGGNTSLTVKPDGVYLNDKPLNASITDSVREHSKEVADAISKDLTTTKEWEDFDKRVTQAGKDAKDAGDKAIQAGEDAKQAGISAERAGDDAKKTGEDIKRHIVYYASAFPQGDHYIPGKYLAINTDTYIANGIIKSAMIEDGAIDNAKIAYEAVGSSQIEDLAVTRGKLAYMAVGTAQIEDLAVSDEKVDHLSFNHMEGELLDAHKIKVRNLSGDSISAKTLTADKLIIGELGDITDKLGTIADGKIIVKGNGSNSGVSLEGLDADNPDAYTPSKKAVLINIVRAIKSSAEASLDYAKQVGLDTDPVAIDLQNKYDAMVDGLAPIFNDMTATTNFDHNTVEQLTSDCNKAIDVFQNLANSQLNRKIGQTADNKNSVYQGYEQPANPHINDIWFQENSDGTYQIRVYDGGSWISPGMQDIKEVQESVSTLPRSYYSYTQPTGTDYKDGDIWYKTSTDTTNNTVVYTAYKWNSNTNTWDPLLDATSSHNYIGSAPVNPINGDFWMDNTTLKQYQNGVWKTIPTQGPQGVPGVSAKQQYIHIAYATSANGTENFSNSTFSGATYIGLLVDFTEEDSSDPTKYTWSRLKGDKGDQGIPGADGTDGKDGVPGKPGVDGKTSYVHFAYANSSDGKTGFNLVYFNGAKYIGIYSDFTEADSDDYTKYTWSEFRGQDGQDGTNGKDGVGLKRTEVTYGLSGSDSTQPSRWSSQVPDLVKGQYLWSKTVWTYTDDTSETGYQKTYIAKDGNDGTDGVAGKDGVGISSTTITYAVGTLGTTAPTSGWDSQVPNVPTGQYLWTKTIWSYTDNTNETGYSVAKMGDTGPKGDPGKDGVPGAKGADGKTYYTWIKYATDSSGSNISDTPTGKNYSYIGIAYNKESPTESSTPTDYKWTKIKGDDGIPGAPGADGETSYFHVAYANSSDGSIGFTTSPNISSSYRYLGTYTDYTSTSSRSPSSYTWAPMFDSTKKRNFTTQPTTPYAVGDTWTESGATYFCTVARDSGAFRQDDWEMQQLTIHSLDSSIQTNLKNSVETTGTYKGVTLNDRGLTATAGSTTVAMNSTDGFLINNASGQVFHVDTNGNLNMKGNITAGNISGVNFTGNNLTLNNSLQVINGNISADNGNVVINSNGLTIKDGGLKIVNGNNETTTMIRDDGTFATNKGYFSGTITGSNIILNSNDGSVINANGGAFMVDGAGNVTANSIKITGNRKDNVNNLASLNGVSIYNGSVIEGSLIKGNTIIGGTVTSARFESAGREISSGAYYPVSDSIYTPSYSISEEGTINVHSVFPQTFSTVARIGANKGIDAPYVNITNEAFDRNTTSGSIGYGKGYEYPIPYLYGQQGGMPTYPVNSNELSIVWMNDIDQSNNFYGGFDGYKYTEIATVHDIVAKYASKKGRIKLSFSVVCNYGSYDIHNTDWSAGGSHNLYLILTTGRISGDDTYHVDPGGTTFNSIKNTIKIKMVSKKILTDVTGLSFYNLYAELSTQDLGPADVYYLGVLQKGFYKSHDQNLNHTWKIQFDNIAIIPDSDLLADQGYFIPYANGSYRNLAVSGNGSIIAHEEGLGFETTSEYNGTYISFNTYQKGGLPYWTTLSADGIGFSIGNNNASLDGNGNPNGLATRQCIYFSGNTNLNGMSMDNFGNIHGQACSGTWRVYNNQGDNIFDVPFDPNGVFNFYVPRVNKNQDPNHRWGGLKIGWVFFDQEQYRWAETVPAIYNTGGRVKGIAMYDSFITTFMDGWCYQLSSWWNHGVPNGVDSSKGEAQGTNTDAGHRGV